ncbi:AraC family transcriptional regulator [Paenibacillus sp. P25]|nr:AraC family transcriptional regulator [Paenibacillus sp. P25]
MPSGCSIRRRPPVAEIAAEAGFNNPFYFTRQFTAFYGCPPSLYRKQKPEAAKTGLL